MSTRYLMDSNYFQDHRSFSINITEKYLRDNGFEELLERVSFEEFKNQMVVYHPVLFERLNEVLKDMFTHIYNTEHQSITGAIIKQKEEE